MVEIQDGFFSIASAMIAGGVALELVKRLIPSRARGVDDATSYRSELRGEISRLQSRIIELENEREGMIDQHNKLFQEHALLTAEHAISKGKINDLSRRFEDLTVKVNTNVTSTPSTGE